MWDTIAWCAENRKMVWLKYETIDGETISRRVAPYSYRTRRTKVRGKATYFYGQDFTPGEDHTIKCFLVDNCLDAKKSPSSFFPKFTVEIKQEIDQLEQKRIDDEKREEEEKTKKEQAQKEKAKDVGHEIKAKQKTRKDIEQSKKIPKKEDPSKPKKVEVVKGKEEQEVEQPEETPEEEVNVGAVNIDSNDNKDDKPDENAVTITDDEGNMVKESDDEDSFMHGQCHQWAWNNWKKGDKFFVLTEYDDDIESQALLHCGLYRDGMYIDAATQSDNIEDILENFDYGDYEEMILDKDEFKDFCIDFGLPLTN